MHPVRPAGCFYYLEGHIGYSYDLEGHIGYSYDGLTIKTITIVSVRGYKVHFITIHSV